MDYDELGYLELGRDDGQTVVDACCSNGTYAACAHSSGISVCFLSKLELPPLVFHSNFLPAAAICVQIGQLGSWVAHRRLPHQQQQTLLAAATASGVLLWVLEEAYAAAADEQPTPTPLRLMDDPAAGATASEALTMTSGPRDVLLAVGCNSTVLVWDLQELEVVYRLDGHQGVITAVLFSPCQQHQLITAAEDRTFKVWDLDAGQLLYQSSILGAAVPTCLAMEASCARLAMGCVDGSIRQFDLSMLPTCQELQVLDMSQSMQQTAAAAVQAAAAAGLQQQRGPRTITAASGSTAAGLPALRQQLQQLTSISSSSSCDAAASQEWETLAALTEGSGCVLGLQFVQQQGRAAAAAAGACGPRSIQYNSHSQQLLAELLQPPLQLLVCTRRGLALVNVSSGGVEQCFLFGADAFRLWSTVSAADSSCFGNAQGEARKQKSYGSVSQLQQPSSQQLQQQARWLSCFRALPVIEQPIAACCFAMPPKEQGQQQLLQGVLCCLASTNSSASLLQLQPAHRDKSKYVPTAASGLKSSSSSSNSSPAGWQQLCVFQTQPLPANSPLLPKSARLSSSSNGSVSKRGSSSDSAASPLLMPVSGHILGSSSSGSSSSSSSSCTQQPSSNGRATWSESAGNSSNAAGRLHATAADSRIGAGSSRKPTPNKAASSMPKSPTKSSKAVLSDKAVTFHKQIKSSGYGFVQPKMKLGQAKPTPIKVGPKANKVPQLMAQQLAANKQYPLNSGPPAALLPDQVLPGDAAAHAGGIVRLSFAGDGCRLLTASSDRTARCLWLPMSKHSGAGTTFVGHNGPVSSVSWSHDGERLLTCSADRTARLWSCTEASPLITFNALHQATLSSSGSGSNAAGSTRRSSSGSSSSSSRTAGAASSSSSGSSSSQRPYLAEVTAARFFYIDEFILLATGNKLHLYRYKLADGPVDDDIQRLRAMGSYSLAGSYSSSCQTISDVAAANSFLSTLLLVACSNRSIELVDAATLQVCCSLPDAHSRPVQRLMQPTASPFVSHPREVHDLFASSAPDGLVKLWDVRSGTCVRSFSGHKNSSSQVPIGMAFSPCMHYLATGSEDKVAYVYDLRTCSLLNRLRPPGQADVVADVAFHPCKPQLVAACMNGRLHWYADAC